MSDEKTHALDYLADATRFKMQRDTLENYIIGLDEFSDDVVKDACARLSGTETFFPALSKIRLMCVAVIREDQQPFRDDVRSSEIAYQPISKPRAAMWIDHLKAVLSALKHGARVPKSPEPLDSTDDRTTYRCSECRDSGWQEWVCPGGQRRNCGRSEQSKFVDGIFIGSCRVAHNVVSRCGCRMRASAR